MEVCYAYLADVGSDGKGLLTPFDVEDKPNTHIDRSHRPAARKNSLDSIREEAATEASCWSRWFTRGWTLQELIASRRLHFFAEPWNFIGVLSANAEQVSSITNIPTLLLRKKVHLGSYSIARRMSWASLRVTTRAEDEAYCLLGILGVNMPLLYGEGRKAFIRLQEEVIRITTDDSFLAWACESISVSTNPDGYPLAVSPLQYAQCGYIVPGTSGGPSWSMTNQGLKMNLPLTAQRTRKGRWVNYRYFIASLSCHDERNITRSLYIALESRHRPHAHQRRDSSDKCRLCPLSVVRERCYKFSQFKSPANREIIIQREHRTEGYGSQRQLYIRYVSFNPYQRIELPFRPLHIGSNDKWAVPLSLDYEESPNDALLTFELQVECTTSFGSRSGVQMQRELIKDVCSIHMAWEKGYPQFFGVVWIDATRDAEIDTDERGLPYEIRPVGREDLWTTSDWNGRSYIHHLNEHFDIGAKLYWMGNGNDQILLVFVAPRPNTGAWEASVNTLNLINRLKNVPAWLSSKRHDDFPTWASSTSYTAAGCTSFLDSSSSPVTHIKDEVGEHGLRRLQKKLWSQRTFRTYLHDLQDSKRSGSWLHVARNLAKLPGLDLGEDIPMKLERLQSIYYYLRD